MKLGKSTTDYTGSTKTEPIPKAIDPGAVSRLGQSQSPGTTLKPIVFGPGLKAPMVKQTIHKTGSQGER